MSYHKTAIDIEREIEKCNETRVVNRFMILSLWYHVSYCQKGSSRFIADFKNYFLTNYY